MRHANRTITDDDGRVWDIPAGGSEDAPETDPAEQADEAEPDEPAGESDAPDLGDAGKQAIDRMKAERNAEKAKRRELEQELAKYQQESETETERKIREATDGAMAKANARIIAAEVRAAAAGVLADPADAKNFLELSQFEVDNDGNVDSDAITAALTDLVTSKPYLAAQRGSKWEGNADGGARKGGSTPSQLNESDLDGMSPEAITEAKAAGRLDRYLGRI